MKICSSFDNFFSILSEFWEVIMGLIVQRNLRYDRSYKKNMIRLKRLSAHPFNVVL